MFHSMRIRRPKGQRKTTCSICSGQVRNGGRYCNPCHAANMRLRRFKLKIA